jgi:lipopolysaccharide export system protein LptA
MARTTFKGAGLAAVVRSMPRQASALAAALLLTAAGPLQGRAQQQAASPSTAATSTAALQPAPAARLNTGLVTIESDQQQADQLTGVITATGNVRIVYPDQRVVATARQAQYFSKENRVVLSGDVDIVQEGGNLIRAEQVVYLVTGERLTARPPDGEQVFSRVRIQQNPPPQPVANPLPAPLP